MHMCVIITHADLLWPRKRCQRYVASITQAKCVAQDATISSECRAHELEIDRSTKCFVDSEKRRIIILIA